VSARRVEACLILFNWVKRLRWKASQCGISLRGGRVLCGWRSACAVDLPPAVGSQSRKPSRSMRDPSAFFCMAAKPQVLHRSFRRGKGRRPLSEWSP